MKTKTVIIVLVAAAVTATLAFTLYNHFTAHHGTAVTEHARDHEGGEHDDHAAPGAHEEEKHEEGEHEEHGEHEEEQVVRLDASEMKEFGIEVKTAGPGTLQIYVSLPGEVKVNADRLAHIVPRVAGVVREVNKNLGDDVRKGEVLAVLESRELADAKSAYLAARERVALAKSIFNREEELWKKKITSEREYLEAKRTLAEAEIELRSAEQKLHALGLTERHLAALPGHPYAEFTRYEMTAPFDGTVIEKHISLGEALKDEDVAFVVADLGTVWVDLSVYQKDLPYVREGQEVTISTAHGVPDAEGRISYVGPVVGEETRTALARVVLPNREGLWRPGLFVTGKVAVDSIEVPVVVSKSAVQTIENRPVVFVETEEGFEPRIVETGRSDSRNVEVLSGLDAGTRYVARGAFTLKAQLAKGTFEAGHSH